MGKKQIEPSVTVNIKAMHDTGYNNTRFRQYVSEEHTNSSWFLFMQNDRLCEECFKVLATELGRVEKIMKERRGINEPRIEIHNTRTVSGSEVDNSSPVREDQLQHKRCGKSILRFLPSFSRRLMGSD